MLPFSGHNIAGSTGWMLAARGTPHPPTKLSIEVDGVGFHTDPERFAADRRRDRRLKMAGCLILRFTHDEVTGDTLEVLNTIRKAADDLARKRRF